MAMDREEAIFVGRSEEAGGGSPQHLNLNRANRHGLIAGATGTGKTITLHGLAESFSRQGVPVFLSDVKGDLAGMAMAGSIGTQLGKAIGIPGLGRFARGLLGGLTQAALAASHSRA